MTDIVVPYTRFLEIQQRRLRVAAEPAGPTVAIADNMSAAGEPAVVECEGPNNDGCGTRSVVAVRRTDGRISRRLKLAADHRRDVTPGTT
jgi:hypothetical protein